MIQYDLHSYRKTLMQQNGNHIPDASVLFSVSGVPSYAYRISTSSPRLDKVDMERCTWLARRIRRKSWH